MMSESTRRCLAFVVTLIFPLAAGCAAQEHRRPKSTLRQYIQAIHENSPQNAYRLLSRAAQRRITLDDFTRRWRETDKERQGQASLFEEALKDEVTLTAEISLEGAPPFRLAYEKGRWTVVAGVELGAGGATPRRALVALLDAAAQRNYLAARRLISRSIAQSIEREIDKRVKKLREALKKAKFEVRGDLARLRFKGYKIELHRGKDGRWRVSDFD